MERIKEVKINGNILDVREIVGNFETGKKWWVAKITGKDEKFGYKRNFLKKVHIKEKGLKKPFKVKEGVEISDLEAEDLIELRVEKNRSFVKVIKGYYRVIRIEKDKIVLEDLTKNEFDNFLLNSVIVYGRNCPMTWKKDFVKTEVCFACNYWLGCKNNPLIRKRIFK